MDAVNKGSDAEPIRVQVPGQASAQLLSADGGEAADGRGQLSWALFEWARNPYVILITIYIFSPYFTSTVVGDPVRGQTIWGNINGIAGFFIACLGPILGAIADTGGRRKPWIAFFIALMVPAMFALWWAMPGESGLSVLTIAALIDNKIFCVHAGTLPFHTRRTHAAHVAHTAHDTRHIVGAGR